jgi:hypothetical protein
VLLFVRVAVIVIDISAIMHCTEFQPKLKQGLSANCVTACLYAKKTVSALRERAYSGEVSVNELEVICTNLNQIIELFQACYLPSEKGKKVAVAALKSVVKDRKEEYDTFLKFQSLLKYLGRHIADKVSGNITSRRVSTFFYLCAQ